MSSEDAPFPASSEEPPKRSKPTFSAGHYFLLVVFVGAALLVLTDKVGAFVRYLYSPYSISILVVIGAMYLLQTGSDRSRMYRLELRNMRRRRLEDIQFYRRAERDLADIANRLNATPPGQGPPPSIPSPEQIAKAREDLERVIERLRGHA